MITVSNLTKSYGTQVVFDDVTFTVAPGERVGLVGRNGSGKTTLLRILTGQEEADAGTIAIPKGSVLGYLTQETDFSNPTVLEEAARDLRPDETGVDRLYQVKKILQGLGFSPGEFQRHPREISQGFQIRLNLARLLASEPDILFLDEPTNYLDIVAIRWLRTFLREWKRELILVTHDRTFMDSVTTHTMGIHRMKIRKVEGSTHKLYQQILQEEEVYEKTRISEEKRRTELEEFINRFRAQASRAKAVQSKIRALEKQGKKGRLESAKSLEFQFPYVPFHGRWLVEVRDLAFRYDGSALPLFKGLSFAVKRGDRIGVIGPNGKGKTTLLNLLSGGLTATAGMVTFHENVQRGFLGQAGLERLQADNTVEEEIVGLVPGRARRESMAICGMMLFEGEKAMKKIQVLSGGEKSRVLLGKLIAAPANLLILDEPTNHLDMESIDALVEALDAYRGAVIIATHSEMILNALADRLIVFDGGEAMLFEGTYQDFLDRVGWGDEQVSRANGAGAPQPVRRRVDRKELKRLKAQLVNERSRVLTPLKGRTESLEKKIIALEKQVEEESTTLVRASEVGDGRKIVALSMSIHNAKNLIEELFIELEKASADYHGRLKEFEERLSELKGLEAEEAWGI